MRETKNVNFLDNATTERKINTRENLILVRKSVYRTRGNEQEENARREHCVPENDSFRGEGSVKDAPRSKQYSLSRFLSFSETEPE